MNDFELTKVKSVNTGFVLNCIKNCVIESKISDYVDVSKTEINRLVYGFDVLIPLRELYALNIEYLHTFLLYLKEDFPFSYMHVVSGDYLEIYLSWK